MKRTITTIRKVAGMIIFVCSFPLLASDGLAGIAIAITGMLVGGLLVKPTIEKEEI